MVRNPKIKEKEEKKKESNFESKFLPSGFTPAQERAFSLMKEGRSLLLTGPAGGGKSYLINLFTKLYSDSQKIAVTATTGIAAIALGGTTLHSFLGLGLGNLSTNQLIDKVMKTPYLKKRWREVDTLIVDEISMLSPELFDTIEQAARAIRCGPPRMLAGKEEKTDSRTVSGQLVFGGIQIIATGDFAQLPPVGNGKFCFEAEMWGKTIEEIVELNEIVRQKDTALQDVLNDIRFGDITGRVKKLLSERENVELKNDLGIKPTKIFMTNREIDYYNEEELDKLAEEGKEFREYLMNIEILNPNTNMVSAEEKIRKNCLASANLQLCEGAQVMLLKNLNLESGLANGSRGVVVGFENNYPIVRFLNGMEEVITQGNWELSEGNKPWAIITQLPLKVAWCISAHKCQGMTLDLAEVDLGSTFEFGQAYVALSRVKNKEGLCIRNLNFSKIKAHPKCIEFYKNLKKSSLK